jgi:hypothetical protein
MPALADWWLTKVRADEGVTDAAAAPAKTTDNATIRTVVFI